MSFVDFIIGGAAKSGTTTLYEYFRTHPEVCMSQPKEPNYFSKHYDKGAAWYADKFNHCEGEELRGEASTSYLEFAERTAARLKEDIPNVKLLFVLRDPVERAYSDYWFAVRQGRLEHQEGLFGDLVRGEVEVPDYWRPQYSAGERIVRRGMYFEQLSTYYDKFDSDQIKVLLTKGLSPEKFGDVCDFLELQEITPPSTRENTGRYPVNQYVYAAYKAARKVASALPGGIDRQFDALKDWARDLVFRRRGKPPMDPETKRYLKHEYSESNKKLEHLIESDLSIWT